MIAILAKAGDASPPLPGAGLSCGRRHGRAAPAPPRCRRVSRPRVSPLRSSRLPGADFLRGPPSPGTDSLSLSLSLSEEPAICIILDLLLLQADAQALVTGRASCFGRLGNVTRHGLGLELALIT